MVPTDVQVLCRCFQRKRFAHTLLTPLRSVGAIWPNRSTCIHLYPPVSTYRQLLRTGPDWLGRRDTVSIPVGATKCFKPGHLRSYSDQCSHIFRGEPTISSCGSSVWLGRSMSARSPFGTTNHSPQPRPIRQRASLAMLVPIRSGVHFDSNNSAESHPGNVGPANWQATAILFTRQNRWSPRDNAINRSV